MRDIGGNVEVQVTADQPFRIFSALLHRALGDFIEQLLFAATVKEHFPRARLDVYYRPDRSFKADTIAMAPQVDSQWPTMNRFPIDLFDIAAD